MREYFIPLVIVVGLFALLAAVVTASVENQKQWDIFKVEHKCVVSEKMQGSVSYSTSMGFDSKGNTILIPTTATAPHKTAYKCDDGVTYWRNE